MAEEAVKLSRQLKDYEVAEILGVSSVKLRQDRFKKTGPPYYKYTGSVVYDLQEVLEWRARQRHEAQG